jgi:hypothetical protein
MEFKETIKEYFKNNGVTVTRVEQQGDTKSIVCHVPQSDNIKIANLKDSMEKVFDVAVMQSDMFGMNVVIVEANDLDEE